MSDEGVSTSQPVGNAGGHSGPGAAQAGDSGWLWLMSCLWWVVVGGAIGFGIVGLLTIGWVFLLLGGVLAGVGAVVPWVNVRAIYLGLVGVAAAPLTLAWLNRRGPGTVCQVGDSETTCVDQWSPWPFLVLAAAFVACGLFLEGRRHRRCGLAR